MMVDHQSGFQFLRNIHVSTHPHTCCFNCVLLSAPPIQEELHN